MAFSSREARSIIRKAVKRVPEGEAITHLNIMPMMDMMTILLVAFIFQASTSQQFPSVELPRSVTDEPLPENAFTVIITKTGIVIDDKTVVAVKDGDVDASNLEGGSLGIKIPKLTAFLANLRAEEQRTKDPTTLPAVPELLIIADRTTPYHLLIKVLFSAKQKEAGYRRFRMIVQKHYAPTAS